MYIIYSYLCKGAPEPQQRRGRNACPSPSQVNEPAPLEQDARRRGREDEASGHYPRQSHAPVSRQPVLLAPCDGLWRRQDIRTAIDDPSTPRATRRCINKPGRGAEGGRGGGEEGIQTPS